MIIGVDVFHERGRRSVAGFVASMNRSMSRWYSRIVFQTERQELVTGLTLCMTQALNKYHEVGLTLCVYTRTHVCVCMHARTYVHAKLTVDTRTHNCLQLLWSVCMWHHVLPSVSRSTARSQTESLCSGMVWGKGRPATSQRLRYHRWWSASGPLVRHVCVGGVRACVRAGVCVCVCG